MRKPPGCKMLSLGEEIVGRINELARDLRDDRNISRASSSRREHRAAADLILGWMREAGMSAHLDAIGNVCGRYEGERPGLPCLMLGSHYDTVRDAGKWDGPLGVITAIACVADLNRRGKRLPFAIEVIGFADEEGVRFASTLLGSRAVAGTFDESVLSASDARRHLDARCARRNSASIPIISARPRAPAASCSPMSNCTSSRGRCWKRKNLPVGVVTAIAGATRLAARLTGMAGHAGTVPMALRRDALAGAAECIVRDRGVLPDRRGRAGRHRRLYPCDARRHQCHPRAGVVHHRHPRADRHASQARGRRYRPQIEAIAKRRNLALQLDVTHENRTAPCAPWLKAQIARGHRGGRLSRRSSCRAGQGMTAWR